MANHVQSYMQFIMKRYFNTLRGIYFYSIPIELSHLKSLMNTDNSRLSRSHASLIIKKRVEIPLNDIFEI